MYHFRLLETPHVTSIPVWFGLSLWDAAADGADCGSKTVTDLSLISTDASLLVISSAGLFSLLPFPLRKNQ